MSQITRCPSCQTMFRVDLDALRVRSEGWGRCNMCGEVFQAELHQLQEMGGVAPASLAQLSFVTASPVTFLQTGAARAGIWAHPVMQAVLALATVLLTLGLALQVVLHERDRIAAMDPGSRPALRQLCRLFGCTVQPWRQIEQIVIDSSSFTKLKDGVYRFGFSLRNAGDTSLAMPALELTLTDGQDQPLLRKVFLPDQLGAQASRVLRAGAEFQGLLTLGLDVDVWQTLSGYRVLVFYP